MMKFSKILLLSGAAFMCWAAADQAQAYNPCGAGFYGYGFGVNNYIPTGRRPPYFAMHPPVYYSHSVARSYGYSPFAYGPNVRTPNPRPVAPVAITNHFLLRSKVKVHETVDKTASFSSDRVQPLVIENPYFDQKSAVASK